MGPRADIGQSGLGDDYTTSIFRRFDAVLELSGNGDHAGRPSYRTTREGKPITLED